MKNYLLLFILIFSVSLQAQTLQNPTFGNTTSNTLTLKSNIESVSGSNKIQVQETDGKVNYLQSINIPIPFTPVNYAPSTPTLGAHLGAIDTRLGQIGNTTAGITNRIYFTGDNVTVTAGTFFASNGTGKGTATSGIPTPLVNGDNQKQYFTKDVISIAQPSATTAPPGNYSGQLTVTSSPTPNGTQQRYTIEIYKTNNGGTPIASGITGAPTGNLGVTVVAILDSGLINLVAGAITNISLNGNLASTLSLATGERLRYHVSAQKVGSGGGNVTMSVLYGSDYNSYYDVTVSQKTSTVINDSGVSGFTASDALNNLNNGKINGTGTINYIPIFTASKTLGDSFIYQTTEGIKTGAQNTTFGVGFSVSKFLTAINKHSFDDYSLINTTSGNEGFGVFDASTEMTGSNSNDHLNGYQSRLNYSASVGMTGPNYNIYGMTSYLSQNRITGSGHLTVAKGFFARDLGGIAGTVDNLYGLHVDPQTKGSVTNWDIHATGKNNHFGAVMIGAVPAQWNAVDSFVNTGISNFSGLAKFTSQVRISSASNTVPALQIGDYINNFGWGVFESNTTGNLFVNSKNSGSIVQGFEIARNTGNTTFYGSITAPNASLTGTPTAPTATAGTNTTQVATTAFVNSALPTSGGYTPTLTGVSNTTSISHSSKSAYTKVGNIVTFKVAFSIVPTVINTATSFDITLPIARANTGTDTIGSGSIPNTGANYSSCLAQSTTTTTVRVYFYALGISSSQGVINCEYDITQ